MDRSIDDLEASCRRVFGAPQGQPALPELIQAIGRSSANSELATVTSTLEEVGSRALALREKARVGAAARAAISLVTSRLDQGDVVRNDSFFTDSGTGQRSSADELLEGVLIAAQRSYEERKLPHLGALYANLAFEPDVDGQAANWFLRIADELTWPQFVLLHIVGSMGGPERPDVDLAASDASSWPSWSVRSQLADLGWGRRELIGGKREETERLKLPRINMRLRDQQLVGSGVALHYLLSLDSIDSAEAQRVLESLCEPLSKPD